MHISVVIPTLNEAGCLADTLSNIRSLGPLEIIIADGGSTDGTKTAAALADRFLDAPRGRAHQMNHGASQARGDTLLFLHADCTLEDGALAAAERCLRRPGVVGGCFQQTVRARGLLYRCIDGCATGRVRWTGLGYGDQGLFLRRDLFVRMGGFPEVRFMEDLLFCRQLRRAGQIVVANKRIFVSPRRWQRVGIIRQSMRNWTLTALAAVGVDPDRLARFYPDVR